MTVVTRPSPSKPSATQWTDQTLSTRIVRYASASCALSSLCATESRADIVMIDVGATGFNINQVNGNLSAGQFKTVNNFPTTGGGLSLLNQAGSSISTGLKGESNLYLATTAFSAASIMKFTSGDTIDASSTSFWTTNYTFSAFKASTTTASNFSTNNYVAFRFGSGSTYNYGWLQTTWDGTNFQINSGAYESTANTAILAGAVPVPEPGTLALGSLALLAGGGTAVRRYRKQRQQQATTPTAEPATEGAESAPVS
jgi:hypothetical protein